MPFIEQKNRDRIKLLGPEACENVGDICFVFYSNIIRAWKEEPRWRTAHRLFRQYSEEPEANEFFSYIYDRLMHKFELDDVVCASKLAYMIFWDKYVIEYEKEQCLKNGDIY